MKFTSWVIIACPELSDEFKFLGEMSGTNGQDTNRIDVYACGAATADGIAEFMESLIKKWEAENEKEKKEVVAKNIEWLKKFLEAVKNDVYQHDIPEEVKAAIIRQVRQSYQDSRKYITKLMTDTTYLYMSVVDVTTVPPLK